MNFDLGEYGIFIWPAYAVTALGIGVAVIGSWAAWRAAKARLARLERDRA